MLSHIVRTRRTIAAAVVLLESCLAWNELVSSLSKKTASSLSKLKIIKMMTVSIRQGFCYLRFLCRTYLSTVLH